MGDIPPHLELIPPPSRSDGPVGRTGSGHRQMRFQRPWGPYRRRHPETTTSFPARSRRRIRQGRRTSLPAPGPHLPPDSAPFHPCPHYYLQRVPPLPVRCTPESPPDPPGQLTIPPSDDEFGCPGSSRGEDRYAPSIPIEAADRHNRLRSIVPVIDDSQCQTPAVCSAQRETERCFRGR